MGPKKCCVPSCTSNTNRPEEGIEITYHKFPQRMEFRKNWIAAMKSKLDASLQPSSSNLVCSKHFKKADWHEIKGGKLLLKQGIIPSVFSWNVDQVPKDELEKPEILGNSNVSMKETEDEEVAKGKKGTKVKEKAEVVKPKEEKKVSRKSSRRSRLSLTPRDSSKSVSKEAKAEPETVPVDAKEIETEKAVEVQPKDEPLPVEIKTEEPTPEVTIEKSDSKPASVKEDTKSSTKFSIKLPFRSKKDRKRAKDKRRPHRSILTSSKRSQKRKTTPSIHKSKLKTPTKGSSTLLSPKKNVPSSITFVIGTKLEAQDFEGGWHEACIVEVDSDEGEVLIHFIKSEKQKSALTDEWIPMDSCRLRPFQVVKKSEGFAIGEKCMARWNDSRKFPATVQRLVEDGESLNFFFHSNL